MPQRATSRGHRTNAATGELTGETAFWQSAVLSAALLCASLSGANAQVWATNYPRLEFGSHLQSSELALPAKFGAAQAEGGRPQQMIFRFKAAAGVANLAGFMRAETRIEITLPGFIGADNE